MKTKKTVIAVLTVALIAAFIVGCITPLEETNPVVSEKSVPEGKTLVSLSLGASKSNARTILPDTSDYSDPEDFSHFLLTVWDVEEGEFVTLSSPFNAIFAIGSVYNSGTDTWNFKVNLTPETKYIFTILAYDSAGVGGTTNPVAWGTSGDKIIGTGTDTVNIALHEIFTDVDPVNTSHVGKFSWNLSGINLSAYTTHEVRLAPIGAPGTNIISTGGTGSSGSITDVEPGIYMLFLVLSKSGHESAYVREIVYIFSGFETKLNSTTFAQTLPILRRNLYDVTFDKGTDTGNTDLDGTTLTGGLNHGAVILTALSDFFSLNGGTGVPEYSTTGYHFKEWYYFVAGAATTKVGANDKILDDITLQATWEEDTTPTVVNLSGLSLTWKSGPSYGTPDFDTNSIITYNSNNTLDLTLKVTGLTGGTTFSWYYENDAAPFTSGDDTTAKFSVYSSVNGYTPDDRWFAKGDHTIYLEVDGDDGLAMYSYTFTNP